MKDLYTIKPIAHIFTDFHERFGIPRQAGLASGLTAAIIFEEEFRDVHAIRGMEQFQYLWLIWSFSETQIDMSLEETRWSALVAPPRLGGKIKTGVFASRSPYRPNSLGLSSVKLLSIDCEAPDAPVLTVGGADILSGTAIFDIKPYLPYTDCHPDASNGYAVSSTELLQVDFPARLLELVAPDKRSALIAVLKQDPRGAYEKQPGYVYGLNFNNYDIRFTVTGNTLAVTDVLTHSGWNDPSFIRIK